MTKGLRSGITKTCRYGFFLIRKMQFFFRLEDACIIRVEHGEARPPRDERIVLDSGDRAGMRCIMLVAGAEIPRAARHVGLEALDVAERFGDRRAVDLGGIELQQRLRRRKSRKIPGLREGVPLIARLAVFVEHGMPVVDVAAVLVEWLKLELDEDASALAPIRHNRLWHARVIMRGWC